MRLLLRIFLVSCIAATSGCGSRDMNDLETWVNEKLAREGGRISPPPPPPPEKRYIYQSAELGLRDPFTLSSQETAESEEDDSMMSEEERRLWIEKQLNPEELETYPLDSLRMVGTLKREPGADYLAIVLDPDGGIHQIGKGNYLGQDKGRVLDIQEARIDLREIIEIYDESAGRPKLTERRSSIALTQPE